MGMPQLPQPIRHGGSREDGGLVWKADDLDKWAIAGGPSWAFIGKSRFKDEEKGTYMSEVAEAYKDAQRLIDEATAAYTKSIAAFRGGIRNDLSAIASSAEKVQAEVGKMQRAYQAAVETLNSPAMQSAIQNAERLATALNAVSELKNHSITFAVLDKKPAA